MHDTLRLGRVWGVPVGVHWSVLVIGFLIAWSLASVTLPELAPGQPAASYWLVGSLAAVAFLGSVLVHELGHARVARAHGVGVEGITLWALGGVARLGGQPGDPATELKVALAGPATSIALGAGAGAAALLTYAVGGPRLVVAALGWFGLMNGILAVFNLVPAAPLDGGRVLTAILWWRSGDPVAARRSAARAGQVTGLVFVALGLLEVMAGLGPGGLWLAFIGWFLLLVARAEGDAEVVRAALGRTTVGQVMSPLQHAVDARTSVADAVRLLAVLPPTSSFLVVDPWGAPTGVATLSRVAAVPPTAWVTTPVDTVAVPLERLLVVGPDELVIDVLARRFDAGLLVREGDRLVGFLAASDLRALVERSAAERPPAGGAAPGPGRRPPDTWPPPTGAPRVGGPWSDGPWPASPVAPWRPWAPPTVTGPGAPRGGQGCSRLPTHRGQSPPAPR